MMNVLAALSGAILLAGLVLAVDALIPTHVTVQTRPRRQATATGRLSRARKSTKVLLAAGIGAGIIIWALTGWAIAIIIAPLALVGIPTLLRAPDSTATIERLKALEVWTRGLSGLVIVGAGIEQALAVAVDSAPDSIQKQLRLLNARINAGRSTHAALRQFADDLADPTGDIIVANLLLAATKRGPGLAASLDDLAAIVSQEVESRQKIEEDRAKPRTTARLVSLITLIVLSLATLSGYMGPYGENFLGQAILGLLLAGYVGALIWLRSLSTTPPPPRLLTEGGK